MNTDRIVRSGSFEVRGFDYRPMPRRTAQSKTDKGPDWGLLLLGAMAVVVFVIQVALALLGGLINALGGPGSLLLLFGMLTAVWLLKRNAASRPSGSAKA